jgi:hypothetical protein
VPGRRGDDGITRWGASAGHWRDSDPAILVNFDVGYDVARLAWLLADLPVLVLAWLRSDRVMRPPAPPRQPGSGLCSNYFIWTW